MSRILQSWSVGIEDYALLAIASVPLTLFFGASSSSSSPSSSPLQWSSMLFYVCIIAAIWLTNRCITSPNQPRSEAQSEDSKISSLGSVGSPSQGPRTREGKRKAGGGRKEEEEGKGNGKEKERGPPPQDTIIFATSSLFLIYAKGSISAVSLYHALVALALAIQNPSPSSSSSPETSAALTLNTLCPNSAHLNPSLFTFTPTSTTLLLTLLLSSGMRLLAFAQLGRDFTFALAPPGRLVTWGLYRYVRHPSYVGLAVLLGSHALLFYRPDGIVACFLPEGVLGGGNDVTAGGGGVLGAWSIRVPVPSWVGILGGGVDVDLWTAWSVLCCSVLIFGAFVASLRVRDEERMLEAEFRGKGKGWEEWVARTWRLVPFVY